MCSLAGDRVVGMGHALAGREAVAMGAVGGGVLADDLWDALAGGVVADGFSGVNVCEGPRVARSVSGGVTRGRGLQAVGLASTSFIIRSA